MNTNVQRIPFSVAGSHLRFHMDHACLRRVEYGTARHAVSSRSRAGRYEPTYYELATFVGDHEVAYRVRSTPWELELIADAGRVKIAFADTETWVFEARGVKLRLIPCKPCSWVSTVSPARACVADNPGMAVHHFQAGAGNGVRLARSRSNVANTHGEEQSYEVWFTGEGVTRGAVHTAATQVAFNEAIPSFDHASSRTQSDYEDWADHRVPVPAEFSDAADTAWYLLWNLQMPKSEGYRRRALPMSKLWMNRVWSWDNCFNAIALADADPELAWDQIRLILDYQTPTGQLPDCVHDAGPEYGFVKPPILGWTIQQIIRRSGLDACREVLAQIYEPICRATDWWYDFRDPGSQLQCEYRHGCDSGWDNGSVFASGNPIQSAELSAMLVVQMQTLQQIADLMGKHEDADRWKKRAATQLARLLNQPKQIGRFGSVDAVTGKATTATCLLPRLAIILGKQLPADARAELVSDLSPEGPFLTKFGLATEAPDSPHYVSNGYWRGPIWAPSTMLAWSGLVDAGEEELAVEIATRFCKTVAADQGMWENYDPLTGEGLRCPGYSWTPAVFLTLANWLHERASVKVTPRQLAPSSLSNQLGRV